MAASAATLPTSEPAEAAADASAVSRAAILSLRAFWSAVPVGVAVPVPAPVPVPVGAAGVNTWPTAPVTSRALSAFSND